MRWKVAGYCKIAPRKVHGETKKTANGGNISEMFTVFCSTTCEILKLQRMNGFLSVKEQLLCGLFFKHIHHTSTKMLVRPTCM